MRISIGPALPGFGSWDWIGADLSDALQRTCDVVPFTDEVPDCDVALLVKHFPERENLIALAERVPVVFSPVDRYGSSAEIDRHAAFLERCAGIVVHAESLRKYFASYALVDYLDHHVKYIAEIPTLRKSYGPILWVGVRSNLPPLAAWCHDYRLPAPLLVLTNPEDPQWMPSPQEFGFPADCDVRLEVWTPERHRTALLESRAAIDIKGEDFRSRHKPPSKALDYLASGLPLAVNAGHCSIRDLQQRGFELADVAEPEVWLSEDYWRKTQEFGRPLRDELSRERIAVNLRTILERAVERNTASVPRRPFQPAPGSISPAPDSSRPTRVAVVSLLFNWPSTGGGTVHTTETAKFLSEAGYDVRHFSARFAPWELGMIREEPPFPVTTLDFHPEEWNAAMIGQRFRAAVDAFAPEAVIITDSWNFKPVLAEALQHHRCFLRLAAQECLCPLNNLRLLVDDRGQASTCPHNQLASPEICRSCVARNDWSSGSLHRAERELAGFAAGHYGDRLRRAFAKAAGVLVVNPAIGEMVQPFARAVHVIPSGFDPARFPWPFPDETEPPGDRNKASIVFAGVRTEFLKGFHVLRAACAKLWQQRQDFEVIVTSDPPDDPEPFVRSIGWKSQAELPRVLREADALVFPTVAEDALGRTAVEAMGVGRPVIASRIGGLPFTVADGETGLLFTPGDADDLAAKLEQMIDDAVLRTRLGEAGRQRFDDRFLWPTVIEKQYRPLLDGGGSGLPDKKRSDDSASGPSSTCPKQDLHRVSRAFASLVRRKGQMTPAQYFRIAVEVLMRTPCRLLVFGAGRDTKLWAVANAGGKTVVLEDKRHWQKVARRAGVEVVPVTYSTQLKQGLVELADDLDDRLRTLLAQNWDVIVVDGPAGWHGDSPGRQQSIAWAGGAARAGTTVFVHDSQRAMERASIRRYLKPANERYGRSPHRPDQRALLADERTVCRGRDADSNGPPDSRSQPGTQPGSPRSQVAIVGLRIPLRLTRFASAKNIDQGPMTNHQ